MNAVNLIGRADNRSWGLKNTAGEKKNMGDKEPPVESLNIDDKERNSDIVV